MRSVNGEQRLPADAEDGAAEGNRYAHERLFEFLMEELKLTEAVITDGLDILQMLREIGPGENGFQNNAFNLSE